MKKKAKPSNDAAQFPVVYTNNHFEGRYGTGAAIVFAHSATEAAEELNKVLKFHGLREDARPEHMLSMTKGVRLLHAG